MKKITPAELTSLARYIHELCGIYLDATKDYLIENRLAFLIDKYQCENYSQLQNRAQVDKSGEIAGLIVDAISTNETSFFRDKTPFDLLEHYLIPRFIEAQGVSRASYSLRIWSAASSTGQEIYSIAMILKELFFDLFKHQFKLLGTDISDAAIGYASYGRYSKTEIDRGLSPERLSRYFDFDGKYWKIKDELRALAIFQKTNLLGALQSFGKFDIIFCRNVAIYFTPENRKKLFENLANCLSPGGVLIIGSTESLFGITDRFIRKEFHKSVYYEVRST